MAEIIKKITTKSEFSKKITVGILSVYALIIFTMIVLLAFVNVELGGSFIAILGIVTPVIMLNVGYYFNKSKSENLLKINNSSNIVTDTTEFNDIDNAEG